MFKRAFYSTMALLLAAPALAKVDAVDGYVRLLPPGSPNTAAFMVLRNDGDKPVKLVAGASPEAGRVELHTHLHEDGVMKMVHVEEGFAIPAGETRLLDRGGDHVMLLGLTQPLADGDVVRLALDFGDCGTEEVEAVVDNQRMGGGHGEGHDHGHGHAEGEHKGH